MAELIKNSQRPESENCLTYSRTLVDAASVQDYFAALSVIQDRFMPSFGADEYSEKAISTLEWLKDPKNLSSFEEANRHAGKSKFLPDCVQATRLAVSLFFELGREVFRERENPVYKQSVAFDPKSMAFKCDLHRVTYNLFKKLKNYGLDRRDFVLEKKYGFEMMSKVSTFYKTGGHEYKTEATDAVSTILFERYWETLRETAKALSIPGRKLVC